MKLKKSFNNKLKSYGLLASAIAAGQSVNGQNYFTDVNPDQTITGNGNNYLVNINGGPMSEFDIGIFSNTFSSTLGGGVQFSSGSVGSVFINGLSSAQVLATSASSYAAALNASAAIQASMPSHFWTSNTIKLARGNRFFSTSVYGGGGSNSFSYGFWAGNVEKYLAIRIPYAPGDYAYGWIRLRVHQGPNVNTFTIREFAYEQTANTSIQAGEGGSPPPTGITENLLENKVNVHSSENSIHINLLDASVHRVSAKVFDPSGRTITEQEITSDNNVLAVNEPGVYIVHVVAEEGVLVRKVVVN